MQEINENIGQDTHLDTAGEGNQRSEKRYQDLANNVAKLAKEKEDLLRSHEAEKAEMATKQKELEFKSNFLEASFKYPNAKEFEADIKAKALAGYSVEDAIVSTLASKGKLVSPEIRTQQIRSQAIGGSADTTVREFQKDDPTFGGDRAKMREEIIRLSQTGEIR